MPVALPTVGCMNTACHCFTESRPQAALEVLKKRFVSKLSLAVYPVVTLLAVVAAVSAHA